MVNKVERVASNRLPRTSTTESCPDRLASAGDVEVRRIGSAGSHRSQWLDADVSSPW